MRWRPFLAVTVVLIDLGAREVPLGALLAAAIVGATVAGVGALYSLIAAGAARASGPMEDPNDLAYVLVVALPLLVAVRPAGRRLRVVAVGFAAAVLVAGAAATFSRGGALALAAAVGWLVLRRALPLRVLAGALAGLAVAGVTAVLFAGPALAKSVQEKSFIAESNVDTRELRWQAAARMLAENPVLGVGPGGFRSEYAAASHNAEIAEQTPVAHNMFLEVAAELGLPALMLFIGLLATALVASEHVRRMSSDPRPMVAVQAGLIAAAVASTFLSEQYYLSLWTLVVLAIAADLRTRQMRGAGNAGAPCDQ
jgi:putative inorganic carbon (hco3(-)) transporter